jgi:hypothetical protein
MKKLILITGLLLATNVFALDESDKRAVKIFNNPYAQPQPQPQSSSCVHGYVFLVTQGSGESPSNSIVQVFERVKVFEGHKSLPMRCEIIGAGKNATARVIRREQD